MGRHAVDGDPIEAVLDHVAQTDHNVREMRFQLAAQEHRHEQRFNEFKEAVMATVDELAGRLGAALDRIEEKVRSGDAAQAEVESLRQQLADAQATAQTADANAVAWAAGQFEPLVQRVESLVPAAPAVPESEPTAGESVFEDLRVGDPLTD